ncbi:hypothetical protein MVEN_00018500 [Mycena venus]|uniref:Uncharacterized protein n=1 Tax=Mycena venus TaxID=2733690 RepID=A0A8H6Z9G3_9AGAR|nr:hypothetical protein MVEN_00018500 [Mycena venus]
MKTGRRPVFEQIYISVNSPLCFSRLRLDQHKILLPISGSAAENFLRKIWPKLLKLVHFASPTLLSLNFFLIICLLL